MAKDPKIIDLFGELKVKAEERSRGGQRYRARMTVEFRAPKLAFRADERGIAKDVASAIQEQVRENLLAGNTPSGTPLPPASPATAERRANRDKQAHRDGRPSNHYLGLSDDRDVERKVRKVKRNWNKRFKAPRLGWFDPRQFGNAKLGLESGMLAASVATVAEAGKWVVYFAGPRAILDKSGTSAVGRVFRRIAPWSQRAMEQPAIQQALRTVARNLFDSRMRQLLSELARTAENVKSLADEAAADGG